MFLFSVKFVTSTSSIFSGVDYVYFRICLGMHRRLAVRIRNFHFAPWAYKKVEQCRILSNKACQLNSIYISQSRQMAL